MAGLPCPLLSARSDGGEIWVNVRGDGDKVLINVTDTGIGISADDISHLFQKFYRVDNSQTRQIGGTGLGLSLIFKSSSDCGHISKHNGKCIT